jgi:hypothetical protein
MVRARILKKLRDATMIRARDGTLRLPRDETMFRPRDGTLRMPRDATLDGQVA